MPYKRILAATVALLTCAPLAAASGTGAPSSAAVVNPGTTAKIAPGTSTKTDIKALFGKPWRVVQFNDCGEAMDDQADETWEYRGRDASGGFRLHIEFNDQGVVHLFAKIPDQSPDGKGTTAKVAPSAPSSGMSM